jgi:DNA-binding PadR family transcriptional regulator
MCAMPDLEACPCSGKNLDKLVKPAVLMLLAREDMHGYELLQRLGEMPVFGSMKPDITGVYRALRSMQEDGMVTSTWILSEVGPAKRCYHMTEDGLACAGKWVETLRQYHTAVGGLLAEAEGALAAVAAGKAPRRHRDSAAAASPPVSN